MSLLSLLEPCHSVFEIVVSPSWNFIVFLPPLVSMTNLYMFLKRHFSVWWPPPQAAFLSTSILVPVFPIPVSFLIFLFCSLCPYPISVVPSLTQRKPQEDYLVVSSLGKMSTLVSSSLSPLVLCCLWCSRTHELTWNEFCNLHVKRLDILSW